jgi:ketosteroid isomerase-like protein
MSEENVEIVRKLIETWKRGDFESALKFYDESVVWENEPGMVPVGRYQGRAGVARMFDDFLGAFEGFWQETEAFLEAGDKVVHLDVIGGVGKTSGAPVARQTATVYTLRGGKIIRARMFLDRAKALEAAGLSE